MATLNSTATSVKELVKEVVEFACDPDNFTGGNEWELKSPSVITASTTEYIIMGKGDGQDEIYIGFKIEDAGDGQENILLNGFTGYDPALEWYEQPGSLYKVSENNKYPCVPLASDTTMTYWATANSRRITLTVQMSNQYEAMYVGFFEPISIERQYPYPLMIGGSCAQGLRWNNHGAEHSAFFAPVKGQTPYSSLCVRRPDGVWEYGGDNLQVWPTDTKPIDVLTVYDKDQDSSTVLDHMLFPMMIYEKEPTGIYGRMDGVYWLGNRADLASRDNVVYQGRTYKVFNNVYSRDDDAYHAIEWV